MEKREEQLDLGNLSPETIRNLKLPDLIGGDLKLSPGVIEEIDLIDIDNFVERETPLGSVYLILETDKVKLDEMDKMIDELAEEKANLMMKRQSEELIPEESNRMLEIDDLIKRLNVTFLNFTPFISWPNEIKGTHGKR